jgi:hypothetical protein
LTAGSEDAMMCRVRRLHNVVNQLLREGGEL